MNRFTQRAFRLARPARAALAAGCCLGFLVLAAGCGAGHGSEHGSDPAASTAAASTAQHGGARSTGAGPATSSPASASPSEAVGGTMSNRSPFVGATGSAGSSSSPGLTSTQQSQDIAAIEHDLTLSGTAASQAGNDLNTAATAEAQGDNP